jgi:hypothetical protein
MEIQKKKRGKKMIVCAHGDVDEFCKEHDMIIMDRYDGDLEQYKGLCRVIVTDADVDKGGYYFLKGKILARGYELVSSIHKDCEILSYQIARSIVDEHREKYGGRRIFGFKKINGEVKLTDSGRAIVARILELRDMGYSYRQIRNDDRVGHPDGRPLSLSTIQIIVSNREKYEKEGL